MTARTWRLPNTMRCPACRAWIECRRGRRALDSHLRAEHPDAHARQQAMIRTLEGRAQSLPESPEG